MNFVFVNHSEENAVYPLTIWEIAEFQSADVTMGQLKNQPGYAVQMVENYQNPVQRCQACHSQGYTRQSNCMVSSLHATPRIIMPSLCGAV